MYTPSQTESIVFTALRAYLMTVFRGVEIVRGLDNQVPMPRGGFIVMTPILQERLATNIVSYTQQGSVDYADPAYAVDGYMADDVQNTKQEISYHIQIDCYGPQSNDWATVLSTLFRDESAQSLFPVNISPLFADDPRQLQFVNAEAQYEERWMVMVYLQYNPTIQVPVQLATALSPPTITPVL